VEKTMALQRNSQRDCMRMQLFGKELSHEG